MDDGVPLAYFTDGVEYVFVFWKSGRKIYFPLKLSF